MYWKAGCLQKDGFSELWFSFYLSLSFILSGLRVVFLLREVRVFERWIVLSSI